MTTSNLRDPDAFGDVVEQHQRRLFGLVLMVVRDPEAAEEVTQDAFVRAYQNLDHYDPKRPFYPWLATIAVRLAQNWLRGRNRRRATQTAVVAAAEGPGIDTDPATRLIEDEQGRLLWEAVAGLPTGERTAVLMHYRQEMTVAEIAGALGVTQGTVKSFLFRARKKLRQSARIAPDTNTDKEIRP